MINICKSEISNKLLQFICSENECRFEENIYL